MLWYDGKYGLTKENKGGENLEETIKIREDFIKLDAFIKFCGIAETGGQAKLLVQDGKILVNGAPCTMRGKKIRPGDKIKFGGKTYVCDKIGV